MQGKKLRLNWELSQAIYSLVILASIIADAQAESADINQQNNTKKTSQNESSDKALETKTVEAMPTEQRSVESSSTDAKPVDSKSLPQATENPANKTATPKTANSSTPETIKTDGVEVKAKKFRIITPMPGLLMDKSTSTTNVQSATGKEIAESKALNVTEFMNSEIQSVSINDYAGNPFQQDLNFRGFTASPSIGTPQGISAYLDGVRINEAFGDVVNWDLIPMNAIQSLDLIPGSNPMFGLNTLGGALAIRTKTGFTDQHARGQILIGDWGRQQTQFSNGINNGTVGLFTAYNHFEEDGWRKNSPSSVRQLYNNATIKLPMGEINLSALNVDTNLTGNGMLPFETAAIDKTQVFTSPDGVKNNLGHYNLNGRWDVSDNMSISGLAYLRKLNQKAIGGDVYDPYGKLINAWGADVNDTKEFEFDSFGDPVLDANGDPVQKTTIVPGGETSKLNGMFTNTTLEQTSKGLALQTTLELDKHQMAAGITYDRNSVTFVQSQLLAQIDENHVINAITDPAFVNAGYFVANTPIIRNNLKGSSTTKSVFFSDTWSPRDNLHITYGARLNWTNVRNTLVSDTGKELYNFGALDLLPARQRCLVQGDNSPTRGRFVCSEGDYNYFSFNPAIGITWEVNEDLTSYTNISRGARTPTVVELGCANDKTKSNEPASTNYQFGCSIPTSLSSDPYLKQVRSTAYEAGLRGTDYGFDWNFGVFRTELKDDILFVPLGRKNRGVFDNFGETLRQGIEMGMKGQIGKSSLRLNYTYMLATFESPSRIINDSNSTNTARLTPGNPQAYVNVEPGDELPGMPNHIVQASWGYQMNDRFDTTLSMVMHSSSYVRGNENNDHAPRDASGNPITDPYDFIGSGSIPGYAVFNFRANYKINKGITAFIKADNIFNKTYANGGDLGRNPFNAAGAFLTDTTQWKNTTFIAPGAPFAAWVGVTFDLDWGRKPAKSNE